MERIRCPNSKCGRHILDIEEMPTGRTVLEMKCRRCGEVVVVVLKNRLYCGELEYRKEYVPDYLEQKRAKNKGELERVIVEGKHQPIVTKEEYERVQKMMRKRTHRWGSAGRTRASFGRPLAQEDALPVRPRLRKDQVAYQDGLHHLHL